MSPRPGQRGAPVTAGGRGGLGDESSGCRLATRGAAGACFAVTTRPSCRLNRAQPGARHVRTVQPPTLAPTVHPLGRPLCTFLAPFSRGPCLAPCVSMRLTRGPACKWNRRALVLRGPAIHPASCPQDSPVMQQTHPNPFSSLITRSHCGESPHLAFQSPVPGLFPPPGRCDAAVDVGGQISLPAPVLFHGVACP